MPDTGSKMKSNRKVPWTRSFGFRTAGAFTVLFLFVGAAAAALTARELRRQHLEQSRQALLRESRVLLLVFTPEVLRAGPEARIQELAEQAGADSPYRVSVFDAQGHLLGDSRGRPSGGTERGASALRPEILQALQGRPVSGIASGNASRENAIFAAVPVLHEGQPSGGILVSVPANRLLPISARSLGVIGISYVLSALLFAAVSLWIGARISRRIFQMSAAAARYARGDLEEKVWVDGRDEIQRLGNSLNKMAAALKSRGGESEAEKVKLTGILNSMSEGVIAVNAGLQAILVNPSAESMFGAAPGSAAGKSLVALTKKPQLDALVSRAVASGGSFAQDIEILQTGGTRFLHACATGFSESAGGAAGILVLSDVTRIRKLENLRREFVANVSHELKTPLTSIRGFIETLLGGALEDASARERFLKLMQDDAGRLERLIGDLLEISRLEDKQISLQMQRLDLAREADYAAAHLQPQMQEKNIRIENRIPQDPPIFVTADRDKIRQVLLNLLDNAIKFNVPGGWITLQAAERGPEAVISVEDGGPGIPAHAVARVFERFYRVDKARSRDVGGTGLGLSIVKHIVEVHGGSVGCESGPGRGARFWFSLPIAGVQNQIRS